MSTFDAASEAFAGAFETQGETVDQTATPTPTPLNQPEDSGAPADQESQPEVPASREIDLSGLPEEAQIFIRAREREMQSDYTRKTQELAEQRRQAEQSLAFVDALNSDPQFAYEVFNRLQGQLAQYGYLDQPPVQDDFGLEDEYGYDDVEPDPLSREVAELRAWKDQFETQMYQQQLEVQLDRQIADIRSAHPEYNDQDIQDIIQIGFATNGDLMAAADAFQGMQDRLLARYLESKGKVTTPAAITGGTGQPVPEDLSGADDKALRAIATERLLNALGQ